MNLLVVAIDGKGLGHLARTLSLARSLALVRTDVRTTFLVESPAFGMVQRSGFNYAKIPDPRHPLGLHALRGRRSEFETGVLERLFDTLTPDAVMFDFLVDKRLFLSLQRRNCRIVVVKRKLRARVAKQLAADSAAALVDAWLVPHDESEFKQGEIPERLLRRCHFSGPVVRGANLSRVAELRARYLGEGKKLVLVTAGGGGWPQAQRIVRRAHQAVASLLAKRPELRAVVVWGPLNPTGFPPEADGLRVLRDEPEMPELMAAADVIVSNAGYNTVGELLRSGTPGVVVPVTETGRDDQEERALAAQAQGRVVVSADEPAQIADRVAALFDGLGPGKVPPVPDDDPGKPGRVLSEILGT